MTDQRIHSRVMAAVSALIGRFRSSETAVMMTLAIVVGGGAGLGTIIFVEMIKFQPIGIHTLPSISLVAGEAELWYHSVTVSPRRAGGRAARKY